MSEWTGEQGRMAGSLQWPEFPEESTTQPQESSNVSKRINARSACGNCKRRKLKCSGGVPCLNCQKNGAPCMIDETADQRRKQTMKRKISALEEKGKILDQLMNILQETDEICAAQVLNLIRSHASVDQIKMYLDDVMNRSRICMSPDLLGALTKAHEFDDDPRETSRPRLGNKRLHEMVLFRVPAKPWTTVTDDDDFVSHLMSLWLTWSHPYLNWIDRDLFIRDMQSGDQRATFCSPFLVNAILADACGYSDYPEAYSTQNGQWSRGLHFYQEAKRLLDEQEGKVNLVNVQGLCVLYVVSCMIGKDRSGWVYYGQLANATKELSRKHKPPPEDADERTIQESRAFDRTMWGIFNFASVTALAYQKEPQIPAPRRRHLTPSSDVHKDEWVQYPVHSALVKSHIECLFTALCGLGEIVYDLCFSLLEERERKLNKESTECAERLYSRLREWYEALPDCLGVKEATPHVLTLHMSYNTMIQTIFGYLKGLPKIESSEPDSEEMEMTRQKAQDRCVKAAWQNATLIEQQRKAWGLEFMPPVGIHWFTVSMYTLLEDLDQPASRDAFISLNIAAKAASHRWTLGRGMLRLVQLTAQQMQVTLPPETEALFSDFEAQLWRHQDRKSLSSQYPNFTHSMNRGKIEEFELDTFLEKFDNLQVAPEVETVGHGVDDSEAEEGTE